MICPQCQTPLREGAQFCTRCGARTSAGREPSAESLPTAEGGAGSPAPAAEEDSFVGRVLDGKYEVLGRLGEGGMGAVYRARRVHIGDEVAVKVLHSRFVNDATLVERFRREARAAAQLHHPNVVTIHDYGETQGRGGFAYIVMELVGGVSLRELLRREGRLTPARAASLMRDVCAGVAAAHRRGIVHRDIKPDNIIVVPPDEDHDTERVKVVDFGIAKLRDMASDSTLTQAGSMVGTPFYMSPEQCRGESLDARADVYSLGALLFEMLAGRPPFNAPTVTGVIAKHLTEPAPPLPDPPGAPPALQRAVARALAKEPDARQRDAAEFAREVQAAVAEGGAARTTAPAQFFPSEARPVTLTPAPAHPTTKGGAHAHTHQQQVPTPTLAPPAPAHAAPPRKKRGWLLFVTVLAVLTVGGSLFAVALVWFGSRTSRPTANAATPRPPSTPRATPANANATPRTSPSATPTPIIAAPVDPETARREVEAALDAWADSTRERDLTAHARLYADTLETYYLKQNVPSQQVLNDRARAFTRYDSMKVKLDNLEVKPDPSGTRATATFDKTWEFEADDRTSKGSVRQMLWLAKIGGRWVITGEKDLKVNYTSTEEN